MEVIAEGLGFPEGPVLLSSGALLVVDIHGGRLLRIEPDGVVHVVAVLGGGPNGAAIGPDGKLFVCNNGGFLWSRFDGLLVPHGVPAGYAGGSIQRVDLESGRVETLYRECDGRGLRGPNDIVFDRFGGFWFTDYGKSNGEQVDVGAIYYAAADGSRITRVLTGLHGPNGIGLSPDGESLYFAETPTARLWRARIVAPGKLAPSPTPWIPAEIVATMPGFRMFDSLAVEADGRVAIGTLIEGGITVIEPDGAFERIAFLEAGVTNLCFGGPDMRDAWATASFSGRVYHLRWPRPGLPLAYHA